MLPGSLLIIGPIHLHRLPMMMVPMLSWVAANEKMLVGDGFGPDYFWDSSMVLGVEGGQLRSLSVILQHSGQYSRVESTQLWYSLGLELVLYLNDFHKLFIILKASLNLLRLFLMSLPAPPSCITVLVRYVNFRLFEDLLRSF